MAASTAARDIAGLLLASTLLCVFAMTRGLGKLGLAGLALLAVALVPERASGLSCVDYTSEVLTLELESVTVDGGALADTSAYDGFTLTLEGSPYNPDAAFTLIALRGEQDTWLEQYE
jgi:hypothetical protein